MKKICALDLGDAWTGIAISDPLGIIARPLKTVATKDLEAELPKLIAENRVGHIIVGLPITLKGTESTQTQKVRASFDHLVATFPTVTWQLLDERLSSKKVVQTRKETGVRRDPRDRNFDHAVAAAFILDLHLQSRDLNDENDTKFSG